MEGGGLSADFGMDFVEVMEEVEAYRWRERGDVEEKEGRARRMMLVVEGVDARWRREAVR